MKSIIALIVLTGLLLGGCSHAPQQAEMADDGVNHVILLWLKDPGNTRQTQQIIEATRELERIPGVIKIRAGTAIASNRAVVDDSFDIGIHMLFKDRQTMEKYISHPDHSRTVNQAVMPFVDKILIYDFE